MFRMGLSVTKRTSVVVSQHPLIPFTSSRDLSTCLLSRTQMFRSHHILTLERVLPKPRILLNTCQIQRTFHTTSRRDVPPMLWLLIKPFAKLFTIISGRTMRRWWAKLPATEKQIYFKKLSLSQYKIITACGILAAAGVVNYVAHLQETPITHRKRYIGFTPEQFEKITKVETDTLFEKCEGAILKPDHPLYERVTRVGLKIVKSNADIDFMAKKSWKVVLVNSPDQNAFVVPSAEGGTMFVFTGLFDLVTNDDQLAVIIGHEMAHALLNHGAERVSYAQLVDVLVIMAMAAMWFFIPSDGLAIVTQWFYHKVVQLLLSLPYDRKLETEADIVGLHLISKACFDVRESIHFWKLMSLKVEAASNSGEVAMPEWLSTHPSNDKRADYLQSLMSEAINMRAICKCPPLDSKDPSDGLSLLKEIVKQIPVEKST